MVLGFPCCCWPYLPFLGCATWVFVEVSLLLEKVASEEPQPRGLDPSLALPQANPLDSHTIQTKFYCQEVLTDHDSMFTVPLSCLCYGNFLSHILPRPAKVANPTNTLCAGALCYWRSRGARVWSYPASQWGHSQALHALSLPAEVFVLRPYSFLALSCSFWAEVLHLIFNQIMSLTMTFVVFPHTFHKQDFKVI